MSKLWKVVIPDRVKGPAEIEESISQGRAEIICLGAHQNNELRGKIEDAHAILAWHDLRWDAETLSSLKQCKVLVRVGAGFDNVDLDSARKLGIVISNVPDYGTNDVADHAIGLLLALARGLIGHDRQSKSGPEKWAWGLTPTFRLTGKKLGIVGLGRIGTATALRAKSLGLEVGFYDPYKPSGWEKSLSLKRFSTLEELAKNVFIVSLHTPLTPETRGFIDQKFWASTQKGVVLINTARGPILNWQDFKKYFESGQIGSAGFDVLPQEPPDLNEAFFKQWLKDDSLKNRLLITPHCAFYSDEAVVEMREKAMREALRVLSGEKPLNQVNG